MKNLFGILEGSSNKKMENLKEWFRRHCSESRKRGFDDRWYIARPLIERLIELDVPQTTMILRGCTYWNANLAHTCELAEGEIIHNPEFVTTFLAVYGIVCDLKEVLFNPFSIRRQKEEWNNTDRIAEAFIKKIGIDSYNEVYANSHGKDLFFLEIARNEFSTLQQSGISGTDFIKIEAIVF